MQEVNTYEQKVTFQLTRTKPALAKRFAILTPACGKVIKTQSDSKIHIVIVISEKQAQLPVNT